MSEDAAGGRTDQPSGPENPRAAGGPDAPAPPGGPLRGDAPSGAGTPGGPSAPQTEPDEPLTAGDRDGASGESEGSFDETPRPAGPADKQIADEDAQQENAETSLDEPSDGSGGE